VDGDQGRALSAAPAPEPRGRPESEARLEPAARTRSLLPHFLAVLYGLSIVYASLQPFEPWMEKAPGAPFFLLAPWPPRWVRYDIVGNFVAYLPFGFFVAVAQRRKPAARRLAVAVLAGTAVSFAMETLQTFLPTRDASVADLLSNATGATLGGALALALLRSPRAKAAIASIRDRWFLPGTVGDLGIALLVIWLVVQVNPGIPLFATMYDPASPTGAADAAPDLAATVLQGAHSAFQLLGVGLFLALLLRERRYVAGAVLLLVGAAALVKGIAAAVLLRPAVWENWLAPPVSLGIAAGSLLLSMAIGLPRPAQVTLAAVALLSSLLATVLLPDLVFARAPVGLFNGPYGHLLNFNGLTHTVLLLWPAVASAFLFALAGRPGWGEPH
jgi:VanZ family protein